MLIYTPIISGELEYKLLMFYSQMLQTEVLRQLSSMGRLVVCAGNGAVQNSTNLYGFIIAVYLSSLFLPLLNNMPNKLHFNFNIVLTCS